MRDARAGEKQPQRGMVKQIRSGHTEKFFRLVKPVPFGRDARVADNLEHRGIDGPKQRLQFIDMARSLAILLMLEGHFIGSVLKVSSRDPNHPVYATWNFVRGFTAPLFFTVAGMIFVYLLSAEEAGGYFKRRRVRRGLQRAAQLLFWGYALQLSLKRADEWLWTGANPWMSAFHVLQCIGVALLGLILLGWLARKTPWISLGAWCGIAMAGVLGYYTWLQQLPEGTFVPAGWPELVQNAVRGPNSVFPLAPWLAFALFGGTLGFLVRRFRHALGTPRSCLWFLAVAGFLKLVWVPVAAAEQLGLPVAPEASSGLSWFLGRAAEVVAFLGVLRWLELQRGLGPPWLLRIGSLTFEIYIGHVIVLYGGLFGYGLSTHWEESLGPWPAAVGAALFIAAFVLAALALDHWRRRRSEKHFAGGRRSGVS